VQREAKLRGLPDGPLSPSAVYVHTFVSNANVLYVAGGHKVCMGKIPSDTAKSEVHTVAQFTIYLLLLRINMSCTSVVHLDSTRHGCIWPMFDLVYARMTD
jgi:hypothetical protein